MLGTAVMTHLPTKAIPNSHGFILAHGLSTFRRPQSSFSIPQRLSMDR